MVVAVGLSAWLSWEHGQLLRYPVAVRVLFAAPPVIAVWLFELQLGVEAVGERACPRLSSTGAIRTL